MQPERTRLAAALLPAYSCALITALLVLAGCERSGPSISSTVPPPAALPTTTRQPTPPLPPGEQPTQTAVIRPTPGTILQPFSGLITSGCPTLDGIETATELPAQLALATLNQITQCGGNPARASDPALQPVLSSLPACLPEQVLEPRILIQPARQSPYAMRLKPPVGRKFWPTRGRWWTARPTAASQTARNRWRPVISSSAARGTGSSGRCIRRSSPHSLVPKRIAE